MVDDESKPERRPTKHMPKPDEWTNQFNPAFSYYAYYCYANLYTLNKVSGASRSQILAVLTSAMTSSNFVLFCCLILFQKNLSIAVRGLIEVP